MGKNLKTCCELPIGAELGHVSRAGSRAELPPPNFQSARDQQDGANAEDRRHKQPE
jgi:hypothetical protein